MIDEIDEKMLWRLSKPKRRQLERIARQSGMSLMEVFRLARQTASDDPAPGTGERFMCFRPDFVGPDYFETANVPPPDANVDLLRAYDHWKQDIRIADELLDNYSSPALALASHRNHLAWLRFWAARASTPERREEARADAAEHEAAMARAEAIRAAKVAALRGERPA